LADNGASFSYKIPRVDAERLPNVELHWFNMAYLSDISLV
jgi:hypothetical protein